MKRAAPPTVLSLLLSTLTVAQGDVPLSATYEVGFLWGEADTDCVLFPIVAPEVGAGGGPLAFQPDGSYSFTQTETTVCRDGTVSSSPPSTSPGTYALGFDGTLTLDPGTTDETPFALRPDGTAAVGAGATVPQGPFVACFVRHSSGLGSSILGGDYHVGELGFSNDGSSLATWNELGRYTFDGLGAFSGTGTRKHVLAAGTATLVGTTPSGTYSVLPDGRLSWAVGTEIWSGATTANGDFFFVVDQSGQELRIVVGVPVSTAASAATFDGRWGLAYHGVEVGEGFDQPDFFSGFGDASVDPVAGTLAFVGASVDDEPSGTTAGPDTGNGTYSVAADGSLRYADAGPPVGPPIDGALDPSGTFGFLVDVDLAVQDETVFVVLVHQGAPPAALGTATPGTGGIAPTLSQSGGYPHLGNGGFGFALASGLAGAPGVIAFSTASAPGIPALGGLLWIDPLPPKLLAQVPVVLDGTGGASAPAPVPADPALDGLPVFGQGFVLDAGAPGLASMTAGLVVELVR